MTWTRALMLATLVSFVAAPLAGADEPAAPAADGSALQAEALRALRVRMEAKLKEIELLQQAGRLDDALKAIREVETIHREGMADLNRTAPAVAVPPVPPAVGEPGVAPPEFDDGMDPAGRVAHRPIGARQQAERIRRKSSKGEHDAAMRCEEITERRTGNAAVHHVNVTNSATLPLPNPPYTSYTSANFDRQKTRSCHRVMKCQERPTFVLATY